MKWVSCTVQPVSSRVSRRAASARLSPGSRWPAGWFSTWRPSMVSSTSSTRPPSITTVATVACGAQRGSGVAFNSELVLLGQFQLHRVGGADGRIDGVAELVGGGIGVDLHHEHGSGVLLYPAAHLGVLRATVPAVGHGHREL